MYLLKLSIYSFFFLTTIINNISQTNTLKFNLKQFDKNVIINSLDVFKKNIVYYINTCVYDKFVFHSNIKCLKN